MGLARRFLRPVRMPVPPHPHEEPPVRGAGRAARRSFTRGADDAARATTSRGAPCGGSRARSPWRAAASPWTCDDHREMAMHLESSLSRGALAAPPFQRAPRAKSELSCGVAVSKPTTIFRCRGRPARGRTRTDEVGARRAAAYTTGLREADGPGRTGLPGVALRCSSV